MNRTVQKITQQLARQLPENSRHYRLDELHSLGFPPFIIQRIRIELERNLAESMIPPKTDWANTESELVQHAWQQFVEAIRAEARLPASYAKAVIETAVADVLDILVQPRKNIPNVIFGADEELSYRRVCERAKAVVVYRHFASLMPRYMQKKEVEKLSKKRCAAVIKNADLKLTEKYSPLNWAQMLEPLFKLLDGSIDTGLLRLFFEDKNKPRIARQFDLMNDSLNRAQLIETLSSPGLLNLEGYEDEQSALFEGLPRQSKGLENRKDISVYDFTPKIENHDDEGQLSKEGFTQKAQKSAINSGFDEQDGLNEESGQEGANSLNAAFVEQEDEAEANEEADDSPRKEVKQTGGEVSEPKEENGEVEKNEKNGIKPKDTGMGDETSPKGEGEETPMWMRFFNDEESTGEGQKNGSSGGEEKVDEDGFIDEPVIDLTDGSEPSAQEREELLKLLSNDQELFVEEIFGGSNHAFDEAVEEIVTYENWRSASKYIEKEIFKRNLVNIYSETAVNFTDRLQSYFLEKQNRN